MPLGNLINLESLVHKARKLSLSLDPPFGFIQFHPELNCNFKAESIESGNNFGNVMIS